MQRIGQTQSLRLNLPGFCVDLHGSFILADVRRSRDSLRPTADRRRTHSNFAEIVVVPTKAGASRPSQPTKPPLPEHPSGAFGSDGPMGLQIRGS